MHLSPVPPLDPPLSIIVLMVRVEDCPDIRFAIIDSLTSPLIMYSKLV